MRSRSCYICLINFPAAPQTLRERSKSILIHLNLKGDVEPLFGLILAFPMRKEAIANNLKVINLLGGIVQQTRV